MSRALQVQGIEQVQKPWRLRGPEAARSLEPRRSRDLTGPICRGPEGPGVQKVQKVLRSLGSQGPRALSTEPAVERLMSQVDICEYFYRSYEIQPFAHISSDF